MNRELRAARLSALIGSMVLLAGVLVAPAMAGSSQGANIVNDVSNYFNGTHGYLYRNGLHPTSTGWSFADVRVQSAYSSNAGIAQIGFIKTGTGTVHFCAGSTQGVAMISDAWASDPTTMQCHLIENASTGSFGQKLGVVQTGGSPGCWNFFIDGTLKETHCGTGFSWGAVVGAGGEIYQAGDTVDVCWGCNGGVAWQYTRTGGAGYTTITALTPGWFEYNDGGWSIQAPPSPFNIHN